MKNVKKGFTLIELLVVILITGTLAAIALPQYQKAVLRSRAAEVWSILPTVRTALEEYCLFSGEQYTRPSWEDLSISIPENDKFDVMLSTCSYLSYPSAVIVSADLKYAPGKTVTLGLTTDHRKSCSERYRPNQSDEICHKLGFTNGSSYCGSSSICSGSYLD